VCRHRDQAIHSLRTATNNQLNHCNDKNTLFTKASLLQVLLSIQSLSHKRKPDHDVQENTSFGLDLHIKCKKY
jgi:hypothetical protein